MKLIILEKGFPMITSKTWIKLISLISIQLMSTQTVFGSYSDSNSVQAHVGLESDLESQTTPNQNHSPRMSRKKKCLIGGGLCVLAAAGAGAYFAIGNSNTPGIDSPGPTQSPTSSGVFPDSELNFPGIYHSSSLAPGQLSFDWLPLQGDDPQFSTASYEVQYSDREHFDFDEAGIQSQELTDNQEAKIEGLTPNSTVYFKMRAKLGNGTSIVPPQVFFNSSKTIAFEPKFHVHIFHKNLNQLGYKNISIDPDAETIMIENRSELEAITPGLFLTGLADDGTGIFAMVTQVEQVGNELKISYYQPSLEQVFEEYHEVSNTAIVNPNAIPRNRRLESSNEPIGGTIPLPHINIPIEVESENKVANIKGALNSLVTIKLEALLTESRIKSAEFIIGGKHRLDLNFKYTIAEEIPPIVLDRDFFRKKFAKVNRFLKAAATARAAGGPLGLLIPKLELEAEFTLEAKGAVILEAKTGGSLQHYNKISYNSANGWVPDNRSPIWTVDAPKLPTIDVKASTSASLSLVPEANIGIGPLEFIEVEFGPFIKTGADAELSDADVAGKVGAMHMTDLYLKSGVKIKAETELTSWLGFGEATVLFDEDYFETDHVSFPEISMDTQCESSSVPNTVKARVVSSLKDGNRLPISKDAAYWYSKPNSGVQANSNDNSFDMTIDNENANYPVNVYRITELKERPEIKLYNKTLIHRGTCDAGEFADDDFTIDDDEIEENGKCSPVGEHSLEKSCCSTAEVGFYSEAPFATINQNINELGVNWVNSYIFVTGDAARFYDVTGTTEGPTGLIRQTNWAVTEAISLLGVATTEFGDVWAQWTAVQIETSNEIINIRRPHFIHTGDVESHSNWVGISRFQSQSETEIETMERNIEMINAGLLKFAEAKQVLIDAKSSMLSATEFPLDTRENAADAMQAAIDLWQDASDEVSSWKQTMNTAISECRKVIAHAEAGISWLANDDAYCNTCGCETIDEYVFDPNGSNGEKIKDPRCMESYCN